ncbi:MAG: hypothetical protein KJ718_01950 [Nanoarchaeota archaeon]|nr:hypothetical protein [Nanoarchaeota archaeon]
MKTKASHTLLAIIIFTFILRVPTLIEPHWLADEGLFAAAAQLWTNSAKLYRDIWINVPPGIFFVYKLGYLLKQASGIDLLFWTKLAACMAVALTQIALCKISLLFLEGDRLNSSNRISDISRLPSNPSSQQSKLPSALLAPALYGLLTSLPFWEGYMANSEIFMVAFSTWGIYIIVKSLSPIASSGNEGATGDEKLQPKAGPPLAEKIISFLLIGAFLLGCALLFKAVAIAEILMGFTLLLFSNPNKKRQKARQLLIYIGGITLPIILICLFFLWQGTLDNFIQSNLAFNLYYTSLPLQNANELFTINLARAVIILGAIFFHWQNRSLTNIAFCWLLFSAVGASLGLRPFLHYLIPVFVPLGLLTTIGVSNANLSRRINSATTSSPTPPVNCLLIIAYCLLLLIPINQKFRLTESVPFHFDSFNYYSNSINFASGKKTQAEYNNFFGDHVNTNSNITSFMDTQKPGRIFILTGNREPWLYYELAQHELKPATPYLSYFFYEIVPDTLDQTLQQLTTNPPEYIITHPNMPHYNKLRNLLKQKYQLMTCIDDFEIWQQIN